MDLLMQRGSASSLINAGFPIDKIMVGVTDKNYQNVIDNNGPVYAYYFDEPIAHNYPLFLGADIKSYLRSKGFNDTKVGTGDYIRSMSLTEAARYCDFVMFSSYVHWYWTGLFWTSWPVDPDQRSDWTDMKTLFGSKFNPWIGAHRDQSEYGLLLGHAANLGTDIIWLYQNEDAIIQVIPI